MPRVDVRELAAIFAGGCAGALARAGLAEAFRAGPCQWPWATFAANVLGAVALGYLATRLQERLPLSRCRWFRIVDEVTAETGLVTSETVPALRAAGPGVRHGGLRLAGRL